MKKYIIVILTAFTVFSSCTKNFDKINTDTKKTQDAPAETFLSSAEKSMVDIMTSANVNRNVYRQYAQYWTNTTYPQESRYDLITRAIPDNFWNIVYAGVIKDCELAKAAVKKDLLISDPNVKNAQNAVLDVWQCYAYHVLSATFGNIPYSAAMDEKNLQPKYDDGLTVHKDLIKRLSNNILILDSTSTSFGAGDFLFGGDNAAWSRFANTLKMRLALMIKDEASFLETEGKTIMANADNAIFHYLDAVPNNNPLSNDLYGAGLTGRKDFVAANTIVNKLYLYNDTVIVMDTVITLDTVTSTLDTVITSDTTVTKVYDPRTPAYITYTGAYPSSSSGVYKGGTYGSSNGWTSNSKPSYNLSKLDAPCLLMDYAEVEFMLAEAKARGWGVAGTIKDHYEAGIKASCEYWGVTASPAFMSNPKVSYDALDAAGVTWQEIIGTQQWLAYYNRGFEGWTSWRRLDYPILNVPSGLTYADIPLRWTYPVAEQTLNGANYGTASSAIGGDKKSTKLYWDN